MLSSRTTPLQTTTRSISILMILLSVLLCAGVASVSSESQMNGTQSGKSIVFIWGMELISLLAIIRFWLSSSKLNINVNIIDLLLLTFILFLLFRNNFSEITHSLLFLEVIGLVLFYVILRQQNDQVYLWILLAVVAGGLIQAIYGNLQLWGYLPSHHGIFKMTGSFFNPGPYAGYLAAVFPIALGFYLFDISFRIFKKNPFLRNLHSYFNQTKTFIPKIGVNFLFFHPKKNPETQGGRNKPDDYHLLKFSNLISIICMGLVLPASRSRAAWLAVLVSSLYLVSVRFQLYPKLKFHLDTYAKKIFLLVSLLVLLTIAGGGLYHLKKGSADGRLLIWKVSTEMIKDKPVLGYGFDGFKKHYMDYQAGYFKDHPDSEETLVVGDSNYAFNEFLQVTVEYGLVGLLLFITIISIVFFKRAVNVNPVGWRKEPRIPNVEMDEKISFSAGHNLLTVEHTEPALFLLYVSRAGILSVIVFSLFSYPFQILPIKLCLVIGLAIFASTLNPKRKPVNGEKTDNRLSPIYPVIKTMIVISCLGIIYWIFSLSLPLKTAYSDWKKAFDLYQYGIYDDCLPEYEKAYPILNSNGDFLTNFGKALSMAEKHAEAVGVLQQAAKYYPNTVVYTALGDSYKKLGQSGLAEQAYLHAWNMNPSRFYPKYLLAKLYNETGQKEKAIAVAKELLEKDIKIESTAIEEIKAEMRKIIETNKANVLDINNL